MMTIYQPGDHVTSTFNPVLVFASYFASLCGCLLTTEILHRRGTALGNLRSWLDTFSCAISLGLVGIWCMHFIGNRAIVLGDREAEIQLVYNSNFTGLSVVLPILGLTFAFSAAEYQVHSKAIHRTLMVCIGILAGLSIAGMHYVGNLGISNYRLGYKPAFLAASFIIAIGDCLITIAVFYNLREKWISAWWKRVLCAMALAGGISAMHFTAATRCDYTFMHYSTSAQTKQRNIQVIIAGALSGTAALLLVALLLAAHGRGQILKNESQSVNLTCAIFDPTGRVLVTTDGALPSRHLTQKYHHRTFDDEFDTAHPVFQWVFRVSRNWSGISDLVIQMKSHIYAQKDKGVEDSDPTSSQSSAIYDAETYGNYETLFKERFCIAAASMAQSLHMPLADLGVLYDMIIDTGTLNKENNAVRRRTSIRGNQPAQLEAALRTGLLGKGQLMFVTREVGEEEAWKLLNAGFRFADLQHVGRTIAWAMQMPLPAVEKHFSRLKRYNEDLANTEKPGTWLAFFAMVPKPHSKGFDIVVKKDNQDQLPDVQVLPTQPQPWHQALFDKLDGCDTYQVLGLLEDRTGKLSSHLSQDVSFIASLRQAIITLIQPFPQEWVRDARFWSRQLFAHYSHPLRDRSTISTLYAFTVIGDMHASIEASQAIVRTPKTFFDARHRTYAGSPDHAFLAREAHEMLIPLFSTRHPKRSPRRAQYPIMASGTRETKISGPIPWSHSNSADRQSSDHELIVRPSDETNNSFKTVADHPNRSDSSPWGGIFVNHETVISSDSRVSLENEGNSVVASMPMGTNSAVESANTPEVTFVDELVAVTKGRFLPGRLAKFGL